MKSKISLIKLNGTLVREDGTEEKTSYFDFLEIDPNDYPEVSYSYEEAKKIRHHLMGLVTGSTAAIPLICGGKAKCPFSHSCPFIKIDETRKNNDTVEKVTPIGRKCLVEINLLNEWTRLFVNEYQINEHNFTEFMMVRELAEIELMLWRLNNNIAKPEHAELVQETVVGIDKEGNALTRMEVNAFIEAKERLQNRKSKLIKLMVGDRQEKYKREAALKIKDDSDVSSHSAKLRYKLGRLLTQAKQLDVKLKEAEGNVIDSTAIETADKQTLTPEDLINEE